MTMNPRNHYLAQTVSTASPARLVVMLYDRLVLDIVQGRDALLVKDAAEADRHLRHAQAIIIELRNSLRIDRWDGAQNLANIYGWVLKELVLANVQKDPAKAEECRALIEPLRTAWHGAANQLIAQAG
jgi:flagellar protein FliS